LEGASPTWNGSSTTRRKKMMESAADTREHQKMVKTESAADVWEQLVNLNPKWIWTGAYAGYIYYR
jgi:hypothetical protein